MWEGPETARLLVVDPVIKAAVRAMTWRIVDPGTVSEYIVIGGSGWICLGIIVVLVAG